MSMRLSGSLAMSGSITATGQIVAQTLNVQQVTSSIVYSSGSNVFGNSLANTQVMTGSVSVTGSLSVNGALNSTTGVFSSIAIGVPIDTISLTYIKGSTSDDTKNALKIVNSSGQSLFAVRNDKLIDLYGNTSIGGTLSLSNGELQSSTTLKLAANSTTIYLRPNGANNSTGQVSIDNTGALSGTAASFGSNAAATGNIRLPFDNAIRWRNSSNTGDLGFYLGASNLFYTDAGLSINGGVTTSNIINNGNNPGTSGTLSNILFRNIAASGYNVAQIESVLDGQMWASSLVFRTADAFNANTLNERMRITSTGDVRINHTADFAATFSVKKVSGRTIANFSNQVDADFTITTTEAGVPVANRFARITPTVPGLPLEIGAFNNKVIIPAGLMSARGAVTINADATADIYTMSDNGLYTVQIIVGAGSLIYSAAAIFYAHNSNSQYIKTLDLYDGSNVTLFNSGNLIRITNNGFGTLTWNWSVLFQSF